MKRLDDDFGEIQLAIKRLRISQSTDFGIVVHIISCLSEVVFKQVAAALASPFASSLAIAMSSQPIP